MSDQTKDHGSDHEVEGVERTTDKPEHRAFIARKREQGRVSIAALERQEELLTNDEKKVELTRGAKVWLREGGTAFPMIVQKTARDHDTDIVRYTLQNPNGSVYNGGNPVEVGCLSPR